MHGSHFSSVACLVFLFLLWPTLLTGSSSASVTATSLSFLKVFGLPTLFSLNYLANWYQESSQVRWQACHAWFGCGALSFVFFSLFFLLLLLLCWFFHKTHVIHPSSSRFDPPGWGFLAPLASFGGVPYQAPLKRVRPSCVCTPSVWAWTSAGFTYRLYRLKPSASRSKGGLQQTVGRIESMAGILSFRLNFVKN